jgi:6-phosphogluconolactonase
MILVVGSYTDSLPHVRARGKGIRLLRFDNSTGSLSDFASFADVRNPTYLALSRDRARLYAVEELPKDDGAAIVALDLDLATGQISVADRLPAHGDGPCHVALDQSETRLFVSNYGSGNLVVYALDASGRLTGSFADVQRSGHGPNPDRQEGPHVHQSVLAPDGKHVLVCDLGTDQIVRHGLGDGLINLAPDLIATVGQGTLPRHLVFSPNGRYVHVVHEGANTVTTHAYGDKGLFLLGEVSTLPNGFDGESSAAALRLHPNGRFLYASNRGHDSIAAFALSDDQGSLRPAGVFATGGKAPRDFAIDPTGRWLVAANQDSHTLTVFAIDPQTGGLNRNGETFETGSPVCLLFAET